MGSAKFHMASYLIFARKDGALPKHAERSTGLAMLLNRKEERVSQARCAAFVGVQAHGFSMRGADLFAKEKKRRDGNEDQTRQRDEAWRSREGIRDKWWMKLSTAHESCAHTNTTHTHTNTLKHSFPFPHPPDIDTHSTHSH